MWWTVFLEIFELVNSIYNALLLVNESDGHVEYI